MTWQFSSVQLLWRVWLFATPWTAARQASLPIFPKLAHTYVHWVSDAIQPSHPLSSPSPPAFNLSQHRGLFQWVSSSHQMAKALWFICFKVLWLISPYYGLYASLPSNGLLDTFDWGTKYPIVWYLIRVPRDIWKYCVCLCIYVCVCV